MKNIGIIAVTLEDELFQNIAVGDIIRKDKSPPYFVVNFQAESIILTQWPTQFLKVEIIAPESEHEINAGINKNAHYRRSCAIKIIEISSTHDILGPNAFKIVELFDKIIALSLPQTEAFKAFDHSSASQIYSTAWHRWCNSIEPHYCDENEDMTFILQASPNNQSGTPLGYNKCILSLISTLVDQQLERLYNDIYYEVDSGDGDIDLYLKPEYAHINQAILNIVMSYALDNLLNNEERIILSQALECFI